MDAYRKLIVALVGVAILLAHRHFGVDLTGQESTLVELVIAVGTVAGVWALPNAPTT